MDEFFLLTKGKVDLNASCGDRSLVEPWVNPHHSCPWDHKGLGSEVVGAILDFHDNSPLHHQPDHL